MAEIVMPSARSRTRRRRSLIPFVFPAAALPVFAANGALVYFALASMPALVSDHPFEDGRTYNREIAATAAQESLGWTAGFATSGSSSSTAVRLAVTDRTGAPVSGLAVELRIWRPVGAAPDIRTRLDEVGSGLYMAELTLPEPGQWQFDFVARRGAQEYVLGRRIIVK